MTHNLMFIAIINKTITHQWMNFFLLFHPSYVSSFLSISFEPLLFNDSLNTTWYKPDPVNVNFFLPFTLSQPIDDQIFLNDSFFLKPPLHFSFSHYKNE